jgi:hypothetical protein
MRFYQTDSTSRLFGGLAGAMALAGALILGAGATGAAAEERGAKVVDAHGNVRVAAGASGTPAAEQADPGMVGKLERELAELLPSRAATGDQLRVIYVLRSADGAPERGAQGDRLEALEASVAQASAPVAARLSQTGHQIIYRARYANIIVAAAPASGIRAMERDADVEGIYLERVSEPRLNVSDVVVQANLVFNRGIRGAGIRAGVVEAGRIGSHINLPGGQRILCRPAATSMVSGHKTQVAGVIQSNNGTFRGMAPAITLVDGIGANFGDAEMMAATDCVIAQGTVAVNMSFGVDTNGFFNGLARYVDA